MSDEERDTIRERKHEELIDRASGGDRPTEPVHVHGEAEFDEVLSQYPLVLVDYHAEWCGPCKMLEPTVKTLAADSPAVVAKVDIDENQSLAQQQGIRGVPTLQLYAGGRQVEEVVGVRDEGSLRSLIEQHA
ncbi:thioredoxin family protein [Halomarina oriensis]|uniref:Thioredoxin n=1 Tax=Halomarina oriensis TaxID=671145 RepID=A0A6B0GGF4_9EURY|nr:thioredoxin family protein [Halomarina oriensis]MWG33087.1 thioredoxin [Halomarina oriensis]